jgi:membrane protein insertase Oxa1/YidC/SpoIIIJ
MLARQVQQQQKIKYIMCGVTALSLPIAITMPVSVLVFWGANNAFSLTCASIAHGIA